MVRRRVRSPRPRRQRRIVRTLNVGASAVRAATGSSTPQILGEGPERVLETQIISVVSQGTIRVPSCCRGPSQESEVGGEKLEEGSGYWGRRPLGRRFPSRGLVPDLTVLAVGYFHFRLVM